MPYTPDLSHRDDPETSNDAAGLALADGTVATHEAAILAVLRTMPRGGTGKEIAGAVSVKWKRLQMTNVQVMRRMVALDTRGQVHRRLDPDHPWRLDSRGRRVPNHLRRDGQVLHFATRGDMPLFGE